MKRVLYVGGTFENGPVRGSAAIPGMLGNVEQSIRRRSALFEHVWVSYPARYGNGMSYAESVWNGEAALLRAVLDSPVPVVLVGYSQGAEVVGNVVGQIVRSGRTDLAVHGAGLLSDPRRDVKQLDHDGAGDGTYGIRGRRPIENRLFPTYQYAAPGDPIARLPHGNPLRAVADLSELFSSGPREAGPWIEQARRDIAAESTDWRLLGSALGYLRGYLTGRHTCYASEWCPGTRMTYTDRLGQIIGAMS